MDLRPCPFCGVVPDFNDSGKVQCQGACPAIDAEAYMNEWNTRPIEDELRRERDELRRMLDAVLALEEPVERALIAEVADLKDKLAELTAERESLSQDRNHWAFEARLMAEKVNPLEAERDALKAKLAEAARLAESTRESVGKVVDGSEAARLRAMLAKVQAWREEMVPDGCNCSDGYAKRQLVDPGCQWHDIDVERLDAILNDAREGGE